MKRILCWFSNGAASAVAAKQTIVAYGHTHDVQVVCCDTRPSEHADNYRFSQDCEKWFGQPILFLRNEDYTTIDEVFEKERYMAGIGGARCTTELKKIPRLRYAQPDDIHVFGFTVGERKRIKEFKQRNPDMNLLFTLSDFKITKDGCYQRLKYAGIKLPAMYELFDAEDRKRYGQNGFDNNNCPACVKGTSAWYWDMTRKYFPETFKRRAAQSRALGVRLVEIRHHVRIYLDELPPGPFKKRKKKEILSCGPECASPGIINKQTPAAPALAKPAVVA
jgi:hypothetical protein